MFLDSASTSHQSSSNLQLLQSPAISTGSSGIFFDPRALVLERPWRLLRAPLSKQIAPRAIREVVVVRLGTGIYSVADQLITCADIELHIL